VPPRGWELRQRSGRAARCAGIARIVTAAAAVAAAHGVPATTVLPQVRLRLFPQLSGIGDSGRVALTFDDGPNPASTPHFIDVLATRNVHATFFLLGSMLEKAPGLGRELVAAGHEVAVHGWTHRNLLLRGPSSTYRDIARAHALIAEVTGRVPRFYRPPYGVLTTAALLTARSLNLTPVLWTCWGKDWTRSATPTSIVDTLRAGLAGGGTVLLHDSDCKFARGSWRASLLAQGGWRSSLAALPRLLDECERRGLKVGPLDGHLPLADP
jgi:peptidoglycan-N-acetylglucosamine deacetylase